MSNWSRRGRRPSSVGQVLENVLSGSLRRSGISSRRKDYEVFERWEEIAGEEVARVCAPEKISRRTILVIRVPDAAWMQELALRKRDLLDRIRTLLPMSTIGEVRFISGAPRKQEKRNRTT